MIRLQDRVTRLPQVGAFYGKKLEKLNIFTIEDLILHIPSRYLDYRNFKKIKKVNVGETAVVRGKLDFIKNQYTKSAKKIQFAQISDKTGKINVVWFNQPYLVQIMRKDDDLQIAGLVSWFGRMKAFLSPEYEKVDGVRTVSDTFGLVPIYPETSGVSSKWLRKRIKSALALTLENFSEYLPGDILKKYKLIDLTDALKQIHSPKSLEQAESAKRRLAFNELLFFHLVSLYKKTKWQKNRAVYKLSVDPKKVDKFKNSLPFKLTKSQERSIDEILGDLKKQIPMNRLLEGDVGSGKTVVAAIAAYVAFLNGKKSVIMAPTQILAMQHYNTLTSIFKKHKVRISVITSEESIISEGASDILIGTHALLYGNYDFENTALVIIDEQHRFGVEQRSYLIKKTRGQNTAPHVLTMTATPIPRTIALTFYGDLDLSTLEEMPLGRIPTITWIVSPEKKQGAYDWIKERIKKEHIQVFFICPLIEESEKETMKDVKAVKKEYESIKKIFKGFRVGLLHGKLNIKDRNKVVNGFKNAKIDILVSTPVVEVGIDIPNANIMVIEAPERFGLSQLHQLRGRVGRGEKKSYCLLFAEKMSQNTKYRLKALQEERSGFKLAELDLSLRGPGEIFGLRQHGFPELKIASWQDISLIKKTRETAEQALKNEKKYKKLLTKLKNFPYQSN